MGKRLCAALKKHLLAEVISPCLAQNALPTSYADFESDSVTNLEI